VTYPRLVVEGTREDQTRLERLRDSVELDPLNVDKVRGQGWREILLVLPGSLLERVGKDTLAAVLRDQGRVLLIPPFLHDDLTPLLPFVDEVRLEPAPFSCCQVVGDDLRKKLGQSEITILFRKAIHSSQGRSLIRSASGQSTLVSIQPRSSWGRMLLTSFLLTSLSARSKHSDKRVFWSGLMRWLETTAPPSARPIAITQVESLDLTQELPIVLMAVNLAQRDGALAEEQLKPAVGQVRAKLSRHSDDFQLSKTVTRLETMGILSPEGEGRWTVDPRQLAEEINRQHLTSYLRRLQ